MRAFVGRAAGWIYTRGRGNPVDAWYEGLQIGSKYQLGREISRGASGTVHRAVDMSVGRHVAVKLFRPELAHLPALAARFFDDARAAAMIEDPGIVTVHECGILLGTGTPADGTPFIVME